jgi:hypothetical protein
MKGEIVKQCKTCPWRVGCKPEVDIPNGYSIELHESLEGTCQSGTASLQSVFGGTQRVMACHYSKPGEETACAGWLHNQLGPGNNIAVRLGVATGSLPIPAVEGDQHETFEETLPEPARRRRRRHA